MTWTITIHCEDSNGALKSFHAHTDRLDDALEFASMVGTRYQLNAVEVQRLVLKTSVYGGAFAVQAGTG